MKQLEQSYIKLIKSSLRHKDAIHTLDYVFEWMKRKRDDTKVEIKAVEFSKMQKWLFDKEGNLIHESGKFFSINYIDVLTNAGQYSSWQQPIINQPEVGILGILTKEINGVLYFLMQAKIEPGNINAVQLSPTLQATRSNYTRVHEGKTPLYLEYFLNVTSKQIIFDQLQSEQGARFLKKRNRNIIIEVEEEITIHEDFIWLSLGQLKELMQIDNLVNMDTRTVISGITFDNIIIEKLVQNKEFDEIGIQSDVLKSILKPLGALNATNEIISWITGLKLQNELSIKQIPFSKVNNWIKTDSIIEHKENKYFSVVPIEIQIEGREVQQWHQPMIKPVEEGICAFILKNIDGVLHLLIQGKVECGNFDVVEMAPTVQCITGSYINSIDKVPFLREVLNVEKENILFDTFQSEEGGRFYFETNRNLMIYADDKLDINNIPDNFTWVSLNQINLFLMFNNFLNIQARSLIAALKF